MDAATATPVSAGWNLVWTSPHPKMPKSVKLRVNLAAATFGTGYTVQQNGIPIAPEDDGSYVIDFMKLSLNVLKPTTGMRKRAYLPPVLKAALSPRGIEFGGVVGEVEATVVDVRGTVLFRGMVSNRLIPLRKDRMQGLLFLTLVDRADGSSVRAMVNAMP
jgi:hypothetical protein